MAFTTTYTDPEDAALDAIGYWIDCHAEKLQDNGCADWDEVATDDVMHRILRELTQRQEHNAAIKAAKKQLV